MDGDVLVMGMGMVNWSSRTVGSELLRMGKSNSMTDELMHKSRVRQQR